ncbi:putative fatty acyl-CoA reductase CG5065 isoform X2 [Anabrus simplex]|uniref:putative fatty acyl-CoA reductase CG5065 isoform X2 n=1 Tax=Anabrus simplex TaxID=316456 RepID=UPI0035A2FE5C
MAQVIYPEDDVDVIPDQTIPEFFAEQNILVTGGTSLLGRILIEKLLRSCPNIGTIYLIVRPQNGVSPIDRIKDFDNHVIFQRLKAEHPKALAKLSVLQGDVGELGLGLSTEDRQLLESNVSFVFHLAANSHLEDPLQKAVLVNSRGTRETVSLALGMKKLKAFVHVSTVFSNADHFVVEEKLYPAHGDWRTIIQAAEMLDPPTFNILTKKLLGRLHNTHIFSKSLAEHVINDFKENLPVIIIRPSILLATLREPFEGFTDKMTGPVRLFTAASKGFLHVALSDQTVTQDFTMPDVVSKAIIIAAWKRAFQQSKILQIYNASTYKSIAGMTTYHFREVGYSILRKAPPRGIYTQNLTLTRCTFIYYLLFYSFQLLPSLIIDGLLRVFIMMKSCGNCNCSLLNIQRQIFLTLKELSPFMLKQWKFPNHNFLDLENYLLPSDTDDFQYYLGEIDIHKHYTTCAQMALRHIYKEKSTYEENTELQIRLMILHYILTTTSTFIAVWLLFQYSIPTKLFYKLINAITAVLMI